MTLVLVALFVASRLVGFWLATQPTNYGAASGDLGRYSSWSDALLKDDLAAYSEVQIEYPPAVLPFIAVPALVPWGGADFGHRFIFVMLALDVAGFIGLLRLSRRGGSVLGPIAWVIGALLLGPIIYLRLDLIPAVATIWAIERAGAGRWGGTGGWLAFGALAKVYPAFFIFPTFEVSTDYKRLLGGAALVGGAILVPVIVTGNLTPLIHDVVAYHTERGVQLESSWGSALLVAHQLGYAAERSFEFGSFDVVSGISPLLKAGGFVTSLLAVCGSWFVIARSVARGDAFRLAVGLTGMLALLLFFGTVYSPQFSVWLLAIACASLCAPPLRRSLIPLLGVLLVCLLTQIEFPYGIEEILRSLDPGGAGSMAIVALAARNLFVGAIGFALLAGLWSERASSSGQLPESHDPEETGNSDGREQKDDGDKGVLTHVARIEP